MSTTRSFSPSPYSGAGGYHQREGHIAPASPRDPQKPSIWYMPKSRWTWTFFGIVIVQALICLGFQAYCFAQFEIDLEDEANGNGGSKGTHEPVVTIIPTYLSLFIFGFIYQLYLTYDALRLKNTIQVIGLCILNIGLLIEAAIEQVQIEDALEDFYTIPGAKQRVDENFVHTIKPYLIATPCVMAVGTVLMSLAAWKLYDEFAWSIYKNISADLRLKRRYLSYQVYITLLKFDFFFFLAFTVQFLVVVTGTTDKEQALTAAAIPVTIIILLLAAYATRKESIIGMIIIIIIYLAALAYFFFKLLRMYVQKDTRSKDYHPARTSLTIFAILTIICLVVTITYAVICISNFGKGLRPHVDHKFRAKRQRAASMGMDGGKLGGGGVGAVGGGGSIPGYGNSGVGGAQGGGYGMHSGDVPLATPGGGGRMTID
ncbi:MAG: hypothetical protein M1831_003468 [Alyxoria varia]|nr:MAG: hypothetical protein M1831_003468 [Alyxoria varia]